MVQLKKHKYKKKNGNPHGNTCCTHTALQGSLKLRTPKNNPLVIEVDTGYSCIRCK